MSESIGWARVDMKVQSVLERVKGSLETQGPYLWKSSNTVLNQIATVQTTMTPEQQKKVATEMSEFLWNVDMSDSSDLELSSGQLLGLSRVIALNMAYDKDSTKPKDFLEPQDISQYIDTQKQLWAPIDMKFVLSCVQVAGSDVRALHEIFTKTKELPMSDISTQDVTTLNDSLFSMWANTHLQGLLLQYFFSRPLTFKDGFNFNELHYTASILKTNVDNQLLLTQNVLKYAPDSFIIAFIEGIIHNSSYLTDYAQLYLIQKLAGAGSLISNSGRNLTEKNSWLYGKLATILEYKQKAWLFTEKEVSSLTSDLRKTFGVEDIDYLDLEYSAKQARVLLVAKWIDQTFSDLFPGGKNAVLVNQLKQPLLTSMMAAQLTTFEVSQAVDIARSESNEIDRLMVFLRCIKFPPFQMDKTHKVRWKETDFYFALPQAIDFHITKTANEKTLQSTYTQFQSSKFMAGQLEWLEPNKWIGWLNYGQDYFQGILAKIGVKAAVRVKSSAEVSNALTNVLTSLNNRDNPNPLTEAQNKAVTQELSAFDKKHFFLFNKATDNKDIKWFNIDALKDAVLSFSQWIVSKYDRATAKQILSQLYNYIWEVLNANPKVSQKSITEVMTYWLTMVDMMQQAKQSLEAPQSDLNSTLWLLFEQQWFKESNEKDIAQWFVEGFFKWMLDTKQEVTIENLTSYSKQFFIWLQGSSTSQQLSIAQRLFDKQWLEFLQKNFETILRNINEIDFKRWIVRKYDAYLRKKEGKSLTDEIVFDEKKLSTYTNVILKLSTDTSNKDLSPEQLFVSYTKQTLLEGAGFSDEQRNLLSQANSLSDLRALYGQFKWTQGAILLHSELEGFQLFNIMFATIQSDAGLQKFVKNNKQEAIQREKIVEQIVDEVRKNPVFFNSVGSYASSLDVSRAIDSAVAQQRPALAESLPVVTSSDTISFNAEYQQYSWGLTIIFNPFWQDNEIVADNMEDANKQLLSAFMRQYWLDIRTFSWNYDEFLEVFHIRLSKPLEQEDFEKVALKVGSIITEELESVINTPEFADMSGSDQKKLQDALTALQKPDWADKLSWMLALKSLIENPKIYRLLVNPLYSDSFEKKVSVKELLK